MTLPILQIMFAPGTIISIPKDYNDEQIDLVWASLRYFRTGESFQKSVTSRLDLLAFAEAERDYWRG